MPYNLVEYFKVLEQKSIQAAGSSETPVTVSKNTWNHRRENHRYHPQIKTSLVTGGKMLPR
jgi:hypothetical protein